MSYECFYFLSEYIVVTLAKKLANYDINIFNPIRFSLILFLDTALGAGLTVFFVLFIIIVLGAIFAFWYLRYGIYIHVPKTIQCKSLQIKSTGWCQIKFLK